MEANRCFPYILFRHIYDVVLRSSSSFRSWPIDIYLFRLGTYFCSSLNPPHSLPSKTLEWGLEVERMSQVCKCHKNSCNYKDIVFSLLLLSLCTILDRIVCFLNSKALEKLRHSSWCVHLFLKLGPFPRHLPYFLANNVTVY